MAEKKKVLIMVASPKNERSGTLIPTKAFVEGLEEGGDYESEYLFIDRLNIKPCRGCNQGKAFPFFTPETLPYSTAE